MLRVCDSAALPDGSRMSPSCIWPSPSQHRVGTPVKVISELDGWPVCAPVNASPATLRSPAHDSGSRRFANPFLCGSCIRYSLPVFPGAFAAPPFWLPFQRISRFHVLAYHELGVIVRVREMKR